jgi:hypothetical protein
MWMWCVDECAGLRSLAFCSVAAACPACFFTIYFFFLKKTKKIPPPWWCQLNPPPTHERQQQGTLIHYKKQDKAGPVLGSLDLAGLIAVTHPQGKDGLTDATRLNVETVGGQSVRQ